MCGVRLAKRPLMQAILLDHCDIAEVLLEHHASIDLTCESNTALMYAVQNRKVQGVETLLGHQASVDMIDKSGATPLLMAVQDFQSPEKVVRALLDAGSGCNKTSKELACWNHRKSLSSMSAV